MLDDFFFVYVNINLIKIDNIAYGLFLLKITLLNFIFVKYLILVLIIGFVRRFYIYSLLFKQYLLSNKKQNL